MDKCQCAVCKYCRKEIQVKQLLVRLRKQIMGYYRFLSENKHIEAGVLDNKTIEGYKACIECNLQGALHARHEALKSLPQQNKE